MIPRHIVDFLERNDVSYERHVHRRACTAQELAAAMQVPGRRVAKSVIVKGGDQIWIAVLRSATRIPASVEVGRLFQRPGQSLIGKSTASRSASRRSCAMSR